MGELGKRVIVALIGAPLAVAILWFGGTPLVVLLATISAIATWELFRIARGSGVHPFGPLGIVVAALLPLAVQSERLGVVRIPLATAPLLVLGTMALALFLRTPEERPLSSAAVTLFGAAYTGGMMSFAYLLRDFDYAVGQLAGTLVVVFPILITWATDVGAYFAGRAIGGRKLMPLVSPGKTISGAVGGVVVAVVVAYVYQRWALRPMAQLAFTPMALIGVAITISVVGQIGDLVESLLKREGHVKDSSHLLPGHGGMLDRLDSLLFTLPVGWVLFRWLVLPAPGG